MDLNRTIRFWRGLFFRNQQDIYLGIMGVLVLGWVWAVVAMESVCR